MLPKFKSTVGLIVTVLSLIETCESVTGIVRVSVPLLMTILPEPAFIASLNVKMRFVPTKILASPSIGEDNVNVGAIVSVSMTIGFATVVNTNGLVSFPVNAFPAISLSVPAASLTL